MQRLRSALRRLMSRLVPTPYRGRLDRLNPGDQQTVIANTFRSGM